MTPSCAHTANLRLSIWHYCISFTPHISSPCTRAGGSPYKTDLESSPPHHLYNNVLDHSIHQLPRGSPRVPSLPHSPFCIYRCDCSKCKPDAVTVLQTHLWLPTVLDRSTTFIPCLTRLLIGPPAQSLASPPPCSSLLTLY